MYLYLLHSWLKLVIRLSVLLVFLLSSLYLYLKNQDVHDKKMSTQYKNVNFKKRKILIHLVVCKNHNYNWYSICHLYMCHRMYHDKIFLRMFLLLCKDPRTQPDWTQYLDRTLNMRCSTHHQSLLATNLM